MATFSGYLDGKYHIAVYGLRQGPASDEGNISLFCRKTGWKPRFFFYPEIEYNPWYLSILSKRGSGG
jgi:hypothetical protein